MKVHRWCIVNFLDPTNRRHLIDFIRLKKKFGRSFCHEYRLEDLAQILGCGKARAATTKKFLEKHGFITYYTTKKKKRIMLFSNLFTDNQGKRFSDFTRIQIPTLTVPEGKPTAAQSKRMQKEDDLIYGALCAYIIKYHLDSQQYLIDLQCDQHQTEIVENGTRTKMFSSDKAAKAAYKRFGLNNGLSTEIIKGFRLSDAKAAKYLNVSLSFYRRSVVPLISKGNGLRTRVELRVVKRSDRIGVDYTPNSTFRSRKRLLTSYRVYEYSLKERKRLSDIAKQRLQTSAYNQDPDLVNKILAAEEAKQKVKTTPKEDRLSYGTSNMNTFYSIALKRDNCIGIPF